MKMDIASSLNAVGNWDLFQWCRFRESVVIEGLGGLARGSLCSKWMAGRLKSHQNAGRARVTRGNHFCGCTDWVQKARMLMGWASTVRKAQLFRNQFRLAFHWLPSESVCMCDIAALCPRPHINLHTMHLDQGLMNNTSNQSRKAGDVWGIMGTSGMSALVWSVKSLGSSILVSKNQGISFRIRWLKTVCSLTIELYDFTVVKLKVLLTFFTF